MNRILYLTVVKDYYQKNTIFIFVVLMFAFGFLKGGEHQTLIKEALKSPLILSGIFLLWIAYGLKVTLFTLRFLSERRSEFLYNIRLFSPFKVFMAFVNLQFSLIQLTFTYALLMVGIGVLEKSWGAIAAILGINLGIVLAGGWIYSLKIKHPNSSQNSVKNYTSLRFTTPQWLFFPRHLLLQQPVLLLITKVFAAFVLLGVCGLYPTDDYDLRLISLGSLLAIFSQTVIIQHVQFFEQTHFGFYRNMPLKKWNWALRYLAMMAVILIPEMVVLLRNLPQTLGLSDWLWQVFFMVSGSFFLLNYQLFKIRDNETGFQFVFFSGIFLALLVMFKVPVFVFVLAGLFCGGWLLWRYFYEVE